MPRKTKQPRHYGKPASRRGDEILGLDDVGRDKGVTRSTVWRWREEGRLPEPDIWHERRPFWKRSTLERAEQAEAKRRARQHARQRESA